MSKLTDWLWSERQERAALTEAAEEIEALNYQTSDLSMQARRLAERHRQLVGEVASLRLIVRALADLLVEAEVLSPTALDERMSAALEALEPREARTTAVMPPVPEHGGAAYRDDGIPRVVPPSPPREVLCTRCKEMVPAPETTVTEDSTLCAECFRQVRLAQLGE